MKTFGRHTIYVNYTEKDILSLNETKQNEAIKKIIEDTQNIRLLNCTESKYLKDYLRGIQDVYVEKRKLTRPEIDNKTVENWAWAIVDFKKSYLLGNPIQYVQLNDSGEKEIGILNQFVRFENKKAKDISCYDDVLTCGRGFIYKNYQKPTEDDEAPFELLNCDPEYTEVIYSNQLGHEQIGSYVRTPMIDVRTVTDELTGEQSQQTMPYNIYTFYLRNRSVQFTDQTGSLELVPNSSKPILLGEHLITEYYTNKYRLSVIEIGKDLFNDINYLESLDKDDMEGWVNAIMVFTNVEVSQQEIEQIKELGAVCINSTENKKASIELLQQRLSASDTQTYYNRLLTSLHQILGVPMASDSGTVSSGDTGRAKLTGQGYTMAGIRAENEQTMYGMCDMEMIKGVLKACKLAPNPQIKALKVSHFEPHFFIDRSDNILTKTQALMNLYSCDIPRKFANSIIGLFGDSSQITSAQEKIFGPQVSQISQRTGNKNVNVDNKDITNNQNNEMKNLEERDLQVQ